MRELIALFLLIFLSGQLKAQNIYTALRLNKNREYRGKQPKKIIETNTFFNSSGKQVDKNIKTFDDAGMLLMEERYDDNEILKARLTYTNDTSNKLTLARTFERWTNIGYLKETALYTYDTNNFLIATTDKDANGNIIRQADIACNEKGNPITLALFDGKGKSYGTETATYLYDKNQAVTFVIANDGRVLSSDTIKISVAIASKYPGKNEVYNTNGDQVNWTSKGLNGVETIFEEEYAYDDFGNCTEDKIYKVVIKGNGKRKRDIDRIFRKEYFY